MRKVTGSLRPVWPGVLPAMAALLLFTRPLPAVEIVAHRGASNDAPENTLAAFKLGWVQKADANELDIYLTKDGSIVVMHDKTTKRVTGIDRNVADQTFTELQSLDAGSWKGAQWKGEKIPSLAEALMTLPVDGKFFIEIKCGAEVLPELDRVLKESGKKPEQLVIIGFDYETMKQARERFPKLSVYWLASPEKESEGLRPPVEELIARAKAASLDGLDLSSKFAIDETFVSRVKKSGLQLHIWTVDDAALARKLAALGVNGITTNRPGWLREQLALPTVPSVEIPLPKPAAAVPLPVSDAKGSPVPGSGAWRQEELRRFPAKEANQGVAADEQFLYVISNRAIGKYRKDTFERVAGWKDEKGGGLIHMNAGIVREGRLYCAHSNFPGVPMVSSVEIFDTAAMQHVGSHSLGIGEGSLTWIIWRDGHWLACFAQYAVSRGKTGRDNTWTQVVQFDEQWRRVAGWVFPPELIERFASNSSSGGAFGPDGKLFVTGHTASELYVLEFPKAGSVLRWTATIPISADGQAFNWDPAKPEILYSISKRSSEVIVSRIGVAETGTHPQ